MSRFASRIVLALLAVVLTVPGLAVQQNAALGPRSRHAVRSKPAPTPAPAPQPPQPPPTPEQMPPTPPQVTYQNGMLTIVARNSTLGDILSAVRARTGAAIETPPGAGRERVAMSVGPAPPRDVLDTLLSGSQFNYVILGSENAPNSLQRVILLTRSAPEAASAAAAAQVPGRPATPTNVVGEGEGNDSEDESATGDDYQPPTEVAPPEAPPAQQPQPPTGQAPTPPGPQPNVPGQPVPNPQQNPGNQQQPKTPEQLLQELQRMQQQQQQQQQGQSPERIPPEEQQPQPSPEQQQSQPPADQQTPPADQQSSPGNPQPTPTPPPQP